MATNGPTLNPVFNHLLARWAAAGLSSAPECEDCGRSLVGKEVVELRHSWLCGPCASAEQFEENFNERQEEQRALGFSNF